MYDVTVDNVGTVLRTKSLREALASFEGWVRQSMDGVGRAAGEAVVFWGDGPDAEYSADIGEFLVSPNAGPAVWGCVKRLRAYRDEKRRVRS